MNAGEPSAAPPAGSDASLSVCDATDLVGDERALRALARFRLSVCTSASEADFEAGLGALEAEFAARGELERREVIERWLRAGASGPRAIGGGMLWHRYAMVVARDSDDTVCGVRDVHLTVDVAAKVTVAYLAHVLVMPAARRTGLAALLRAAPLALARRVMAEVGVEAASADVLLAAEMEPYDEADEQTLVRLAAYGRAGFSVIAPSHLPYCQPDFRAHTDIDETGAQPIPLLAVVRWPGHEGARSLPKPLAAAFVEHLYAVFGTHCRPRDLEPLRARALAAMEAAPGPDVPLLALPRSADDHARLAPLGRAALPPPAPLDDARVLSPPPRKG